MISKNHTVLDLCSALGVFIVCAGTLLASACATTPSNAPDDGKAQTLSRKSWKATDLQPLAIGNQWTYRGTMAGQPAERTVTIRGIDQGFFIDDASGRLRSDGEGLRDDKRYLLKEPIERGHKWMAVLSASSTERYEIVETGLTVETPKGRFEGCVQVRATNRIDTSRILESEWIYAPRVGIVRMQTRLREGDRVIPQSSLELADYRIENH